MPIALALDTFIIISVFDVIESSTLAKLIILLDAFVIIPKLTKQSASRLRLSILFT